METPLCFIKAKWNGNVYSILAKTETEVTILDEQAEGGQRVLPIAEVSLTVKISGEKRKRKRIKYSGIIPNELRGFNKTLSDEIAEFRKKKKG